MFLLISGGHIGGQFLSTSMASPYKALQRCVKCFGTNSETVGHKDLRFGQIVYILVFYNISFSWLLPLDGFQFICLLRDSENDVLFWNTNMALHIFSPHPLPEIVLVADKTTEKHSVVTLATRALLTLAVFWGWD